MRTIEKGIYDAHNNASAAQGKADAAMTANDQLAQTVENVANVANRASQDATQALTDTEQGKSAWTYVRPTMEWEEDGVTPKTTLATRLNAMQDSLTNTAGAVATT
jgi:hypothetical protein